MLRYSPILFLLIRSYVQCINEHTTLTPLLLSSYRPTSPFTLILDCIQICRFCLYERALIYLVLWLYLTSCQWLSTHLLLPSHFSLKRSLTSHKHFNICTERPSSFLLRQSVFPWLGFCCHCPANFLFNSFKNPPSSHLVLSVGTVKEFQFSSSDSMKHCFLFFGRTHGVVVPHIKNW